MKIDSIAKHKLAITSAFVAVVIAAFLVTYSFAFDSLPQSSLTFTKSYRTISVSWAPVTGAKLYAVYSADDANGTNARRIAVVDTPSFNDTLLKPGSGQSYAVQSGTGRDGLESVDMSTLNWSSVQQVPTTGPQVSKGEDSESAKQKNKSRSAATQFEASGEPIFSPHKGTGYVADSKDGCTSCHIAHDANNHSLIVSSGAGGHENAAIAICLDCHDQDTSAEKAFVGSVFKDRGALSGHFVETEEAKLECVTCHGPHQDSNKADNGLKPLTIKKFGSPLIESLTVDSARPNNQCTTCHDDAQTWYTATTGDYPTSRILATGADVPEGYEGYPKSGTYPGATVVNDATKNGHADIAASDGYNKGDCRYCHTSHASSAPYDGLLAERGELRAMKGSTPEAINAERVSGAYASFCLSCHNGNNAGKPWAAAANIADTVSFPVGSSETSPVAFLESSAGHTVKSPNATIPQGSAMPCYSCHDTHGNAAGNVKNLSASLATGITQDKLNYEFCLTCHVTAYGKVSNADSSELVSLEGSDLPKTVLGLSRTGVDNINSVETSNSLKLSANVDGHKAGVTHSCTMCHGDIHSPAALGSSEPSATLNRKDCIGCHGEDFKAAKNIVFTPNATGKEATVAYSPHMVPAFSDSMGANFFPEYILRGVPSPFTPIDPSIDANKSLTALVAMRGVQMM